MSTPHEQTTDDSHKVERRHEAVTTEETGKPREASRGRNARFSRIAIKTLKEWCDAHRHHPYPSEQQKAELRAQTGLSVTQISNWFTNARRRGKIPTVSGPSMPALSDAAPTSFALAAPSDVALVSRLAIPTPPSTSEWQNMSPLNRWRNSPPDCEPAPLSAVVDAVDFR